MQSPRLRYEPVSLARSGDFHSLVVDEHVRRYLMDGEIFSSEWSDARIRDSEALFDRRGVGLWLVEELESRQLAGFCGFLEIPTILDEPRLVDALFGRFTGRGYATEMARAAIAHARSHAGFEKIVAGVDAVNGRSCRVLEKIGFTRATTIQGAFGDMYLYQLDHRAGNIDV